MLGLSLCIQGTPAQNGSQAMGERFIPVYTGNTEIALVRHRIVAVYPCVYREHFSNPSSIAWSAGLSLCIQETLMRRSLISVDARFIPVYTGNTECETVEG